MAQIGDRLEQRHDVDLALAVGRNEPGFLQEHGEFEEIGDGLRLRDDARANDLGAKGGARLGGGAKHRELFTRLVGVGEEGRGERAHRAELFDEKIDALLLAARGIICPRRGRFEKLGDRALVHVGILPQIHRCEMKAKAIGGAPQALQPPACQQIGAMRLQ